ncbi:hypothetical protein MNBD_BACTEROID07-285 [hydrothermal vent metagenome]|uniref:Uncharacterized protein n=1 Tax=hydrothermal vent metagenome TaxID=652676 RepID=A0A3B0UGC7_9ZZZZ
MAGDCVIPFTQKEFSKYEGVEKFCFVPQNPAKHNEEEPQTKMNIFILDAF